MNFKSVISKAPVTLIKDREGDLTGYIRISIKIYDRDPIAKAIKIFTKDTRVINPGADNEEEFLIFNREQKVQEKVYSISYSDYEDQRIVLTQMFEAEIVSRGLVGAEIEDFLLIKRLLINLDTENIYGLTGNQWVAE